MFTHAFLASFVVIVHAAGHLGNNLIYGCMDIKVVDHDTQRCSDFASKYGWLDQQATFVKLLQEINTNIKCGPDKTLFVNQQLCVSPKLAHGKSNEIVPAKQIDNPTPEMPCAGKLLLNKERTCSQIVNGFKSRGLHSIEMLEKLNSVFSMNCGTGIPTFSVNPKYICVLPGRDESAKLSSSFSNLVSSNSSTDSSPPNPVFDKVLKIHNDARKAVSNSLENLVWSSTLEHSATTQANVLAGMNCMLYYSGAAGVGENQASFHQIDNPSIETASSIWKNLGMKDGNLNQYTQMVWKDTKEIGCAIAFGNTCSIVVCQYSPPGNIIGQNQM